MKDWPAHKESCKCARKKSMGSGKGKQRSKFTTLDELRTADSDKIMSLLMEQFSTEPDDDAKKAVLESLPYELEAAKQKMKKQSEAERMLDALNLSP